MPSKKLSAMDLYTGIADPSTLDLYTYQAGVEKRIKPEQLGLGGGSLGVNQTWQDMFGSRAGGVIYTNTTGRTISVSISSTCASGFDTILFVGGLQVGSWTLSVASAYKQFLTALIPNGQTYQIIGTSLFITTWAELR